MAKLGMMRPGVRVANLAVARPLTTGVARVVPNSREHRAIKRAVARRSGGWCECADCRRSGSPLPAQEYDHVVPLWEGGGNGLDNWQHLNGDCHKRKTAAEHRRRLGLDP